MSARKPLASHVRIAGKDVARRRPYPHVRIAELPAGQLLRVVLDVPNIQNRLYRCGGCAAEMVWAGDPIEPVVCHECRGPVTPLGPTWWARASERMRAAGRRDRKLLGQIQAEWRGEHGDVALPPLSEPFAWLNALWAGQRAPGRPLDSLGHFVLAHMVGRLQAAGVSLNQIFRLASIPDLDQRRAAARNLPDSARRFVGADLDGILAQLPFISDRAEFKRRLRWAIRQWTDPGARFRGERVRSR